VTNGDAANVMTANSNNLQKLLALADIEPLTLLKTIQKLDARTLPASMARFGPINFDTRDLGCYEQWNFTRQL